MPPEQSVPVRMDLSLWRHFHGQDFILCGNAVRRRVILFDHFYGEGGSERSDGRGCRCIRGGELGRLYRNPSYAGITPEFWSSLDAVCSRIGWISACT